MWRPYEHLNFDAQQLMLHAAATALQLAAVGDIIPCGAFGSAPHLAPPRL